MGRDDQASREGRVTPVDVPCPTCRRRGDEPCVRGRAPNGGMGIEAAVWRQQTPFPEGHDSRRTANDRALRQAG